MKLLKIIGVILFFTGLAGWIVFAIIRSQGNDHIRYAILLFPWSLAAGLFLLATNNLIVLLRNRQQKKNESGMIVGTFLLLFTFGCLLLMGLLTAVILYFPKSAAFAELQRNLENNAQFNEKFGEIKYYGIFPEGSYGTEIADFHIMIYGQRKTSSIYFLAHLEDGNWVVDNLSF